MWPARLHRSPLHQVIVCRPSTLEGITLCKNLKLATSAGAATQAGGRGHSDFASAHWSRKGWREMARLQRLLEASQELKDLVQSLGRSRGDSQKQRAPQQVMTWEARHA